MASDSMTKIAGFDFDGTLVRPKEGRVFPKNKDDWRWMRPSVPERLRALAAEGWRLVIITDQTKRWKADMIADVVAAVGVPIDVIIHWDTKKPNTDAVIARGLVPSFYVGDAAGRTGSDWSNCDREFAERLGIPFHTPEEFFPVASPRERTVPSVGAVPREVIVMVGYPASGKSTIARNLAERAGYHHVDGDVFPTPTAMIREAKRHPDRPIVFDSTGGTQKRRAVFLEWAAAEGRPARIVWVTTDIDTAMDWNTARGATVPHVAYYVYRKHFEPPTEAEAPVVIVE